MCVTFRIRKALENRTNMEDDRIEVLEQQLAQARLIAEESDKKYEEVRLRILSSLGDSFLGASLSKQTLLPRYLH